MTIVPYEQLEPDVLNALIEEFVTRDGAVQGHTETPIAQKMAAVLRQLKSGTAMIVFDEVSESCTIMPKENLPVTGPITRPNGSGAPGSPGGS
jgi:uncharacterized protein YheU (UPF0270 family)